MDKKELSLLSGFITSLSFLTIVPFPIKTEFNPLGAKYFFGIVGLIIGVGLAIVGGVFGKASPFMMVLYMALITRFLHLDGLADTFDGFFSGKPKEQILEIMKDSRIGVMGAVSIVIVLMGKFTAFQQMDNLLLLATVPSFARFAAAIVTTVLPTARKSSKQGTAGLGAVFKSVNYDPLLLLQIVPAEILLLISGGVVCFVTINVIFLLSVVMLMWWYRSVIDGYTGDTAGATIELMELILLITLLVSQ